jgi:hypothetical protein
MTFAIVQPPKDSALYMSEKDRFDIRCKESWDFQVQDRFNKKASEEFKNQRIYKEIVTQERINRLKDHLADEKELYSQIQRSCNILKYETVSLVMLTY